MHYSKYTIGLLLILFLIGSSGCVENRSKFLHTRGHDIIDAAGNKVLLRGVGLGNWLLPEGYMWKFGANGDRPRKIEKLVSNLIGGQKAAEFWKQFRQNYITEVDIRRIAELGFNAVRLALNARLFLTEGDSALFIEENFKLLDNLVHWCDKYNIYVILDMHGAPGGQTGANIDDSANNQPDLFIDPRNQDRLDRLWLKIAERYADEPTVIAYDLLNEPLPQNSGAAKKYGHLVEPLYRRLTRTIRSVDKHHMITLEGINWANDWSIFGKPFDDNLIYQFHYYCWNRPDHLNDISQYLVWREKLNAPVWVGETGEKGNTIYFATTQYFEANNIGWSFWPWKKMATQNTPYSIKPPQGWQQIADYSAGKVQPDSAQALAAFDQLLENIKLLNCDYFPDVVNSIFRRAPLKIEGENYGQQGFNKSYFVKDTLKKSKFYRSAEPVPVTLVEFEPNQFLSQQCIELQAGEWAAYSFNNSDLTAASVFLRLKKESEMATFTFQLNGFSQNSTISLEGWQEIQIPKLSLRSAQNKIMFKVDQGILKLDWITISRP